MYIYTHTIFAIIDMFVNIKKMMWSSNEIFL